MTTTASLVWDDVKVQVRRHWVGLVLLSLFAYIAIFGGGSRADVNSLLWLRPVAIFAFFFGLALLTRNRLQAFRPLLYFALAILLAIGVQLVPLPASLWASLPGRGPFVEAAGLTGLGDVARPISLYPAYSWNALFAAFVPFSLLLYFIAATPFWRRCWMYALLVFGFVSALIGLIQIAGMPGSPAYFYRITDAGKAVGLFSNSDHHAILLALMVPLIPFTAIATVRRRPIMTAIIVAIAWLFFAIMILTIASRIGLVLFSMATLASLYMVPPKARANLPLPPMLAAIPRWIAPTACIAFLLALIVGLIPLGGAFAPSLDPALRGEVVPVTLRMIVEFLPFGGGGGTFPQSYFLYEPVETVTSAAYINHVHNDYLEIAYAYGLPGIALILAGLAMAGIYSFRAWTANQPLLETMAARAAVIGLWLLLFASLSDYPLRTPSLAAIAVLFVATLLRHRDIRERKSEI